MTDNANIQDPQSEGTEPTGATRPEGGEQSSPVPATAENVGAQISTDVQTSKQSESPVETNASEPDASAQNADASAAPEQDAQPTTPPDALPETSGEVEAAPPRPVEALDAVAVPADGGEPAAEPNLTPEDGATTPIVEVPASPEELAATAAAVAAKAEADRDEAEKKAAEDAVRLEAMRPIWQELTEKKESRVSFTAKVTGTNRGGVVAEYSGVEIFIPQSHWSLERSSDVDPTIVGNDFEMTVLEITQFETDARRVTGSRRSLLRKELIELLEPGLRLKGRVSSLTDFGAFVDLGGIDGLLHVTEISHARSSAPKDLLKKGEEIEVIVKKVEKGGKRISLGRKELLDSPWKGVSEKYQPDTLISGKVVSLTDIGAFVQIEPGVDGLLRPREMSWTKRVGAASDILSVGQQIEVMITSVNEEDERIGLSLKRTGDNPWDTIVEKFSDAEATWEASVVEVSNKGAVVSVEDIEGFLPRGRMGRESSKLTELNPGDKLTVNVIEVDPKRPSLIFSLPGAGGSGGGTRGGGSDRFEGEGNRGGSGGGGNRGGGSGGGGGRGGSGGGGQRGGGGRKDRDFQASKAVPSNEMKSSQTVSNFSLGEMLESVMKEKLGVEEAEKQKEAASAKSLAAEKPATPVAEDVPVVTTDESTDTVNAPLSPNKFQNIDGTPDPEATSADDSEEPSAPENTPDETSSSSSTVDPDVNSEDNETPVQGTDKPTSE